MDILKFSAHSFYKTANMLATLSRMIENQFTEQQRKDRIDDEVQTSMRDMVTKIRDECAAINLTLSLVSAKALLDHVESLSTWEAIHAKFEELNGRIRDEIKQHLFLYIPASHAEFYDKPNLFGQVVAAAFPSADYDIAEAGKCMALHRSTACVYHSMRILERGLHVLADKFSIPFGYQMWGTVIELIEKAIRDISKQPNKPANWKEEERFCSEAALQFMHFKNAWRNYTAHSDTKYTPEEADAILRHVRDFMQHLSKQMREVPITP